MRNEGIAALAFIPLVRSGRLLGKFMLYRDAPHAWSEREILLGRTIANHLASVTERTKAQQELHESREQLATILRTVDEGITVADPSGRLLYANDASARQFGKESVEELLAAPREEWARRSSSSSTPTASRSITTCCRPAVRTRARRARGSSSAATARPARSGGSTCGRNPVFGPDGSVELVVNVSRDITAERLAEQRRLRSEEQVRFLARASELLVASLDWEETVAAIASLAVPELAGYLVVDLLDDEGVLRHVVAAHADPELTDLVYEMRRRYPPIVPTHPIQVAIAHR